MLRDVHPRNATAGLHGVPFVYRVTIIMWASRQVFLEDARCGVGPRSPTLPNQREGWGTPRLILSISRLQFPRGDRVGHPPQCQTLPNAACREIRRGFFGVKSFANVVRENRTC